MQHQQTKQIAKHLNVAVIATAIKLHSIKKTLNNGPLLFLQIQKFKYHFAHIFLITNIGKANLFILKCF